MAIFKKTLPNKQLTMPEPVSYTHLQLPSNAKAGYVIRRILRRAVRYGYTCLGQKQAFMYKVLPVLIDNMGDACLLYTSRCV